MFLQEAWEQLEKTIEDLRNNHGAGSQEEVCRFLAKYMVILEAQTTEPQTGWIPVTERLPEEKINPITEDFYEYQCTYHAYGVYDVRSYKFGNGHWWHGAGIMDDSVIAWRESPEPYIENSEETTETKEQKLADFPNINLIADNLREMDKILKKNEKSDLQKAMEEAAARGDIKNFVANGYYLGNR